MWVAPSYTSTCPSLTIAQGPTIFPILFACVIGRVAHAILLWRLEVGEREGTLDMLAGSTSLTSTLTSQLRLRVFSLLGMILIFIWTLSPVGGQASFRQMTIGTKTLVEPAEFVHMKFSGELEPYDNADRPTIFAIINSLFVSSILGPPSSKAASVDTWSNIKIPIIESYESQSTSDDTGWFRTEGAQNVYSSLVGIPMAGIDSSATYNVKGLETQYLH